MPLYHSDAFVLRTYKLGERDQIVVFFTREYGKVRAVARRSQSARRPSASYYQPLMLLHAILFGRPAQSLYRINSVDVVQAYRPLREDFTYLRSGLYLTELIDVTTHEREAMPELFAFLHSTLEQLSQVPQPALLLRQFELGLLMHMGYTPQLDYCPSCARPLHAGADTFSPRLGGVVCRSCAPGARRTLTISTALLDFLRGVITGHRPWGAVTALDQATQGELEELLHAQLVTVLGRELKSYPFLAL